MKKVNQSINQTALSTNQQRRTQNMVKPTTPAFYRLMAMCVATNPPEGSQITTPCSTFTGSKAAKGGHGLMWDDGKVSYTHRVAYEHKNGPIPKGMVLMHLCDNPACCNPGHLTLGTKKDNTHDAVLKGRIKGKAKDALPNLIKRIERMKGSGKTPEQIADDTGFALTEILTALDFLDDDECIYAPTLAHHGADLADSQRLERFIHYQHTLAAITAMLTYEARA